MLYKIADFGLATSTRHVNRERLGTAKVRITCKKITGAK